jgi:hypothetical protein
LQLARPEFEVIASMRLDVIDDARSNDLAFGQTHLAQRLSL